MSIVIIVRGVPGSGKTTWARAFQATHPGTVIASADDAFQTDTGYQFDSDKVAAAHMACRYRVRQALQAQAPYILVDNTHTRCWEYAKIVQHARIHDASVYQVICAGTFPSVHAVPADTLVFMRQRFETDDALPHWHGDHTAGPEGTDEIEREHPHPGPHAGPMRRREWLTPESD